MTEPTDKRRGRILAAAREIFAREGFRSADVKTIAETAGVGKATIYKFFDSKEQLLLVVVEENLNQIRDLALRQLISSGPPLARMEGACRAIASFIASNRAFTRVLVQEAGDFAGEIQRQHLTMIEQNMPLAEAFFSELRQEGYFTELETRATIQMMVNLFIGAAYTWALTGAGDLEEQTATYLRVLTAGLRAPLPHSATPTKD
ncbi:TetR/AcrR family transcriptional regulator [Alcanivorax quisquiliarum]|uniref:TetR/AcrR family transcriptional regulator n=1 Tax=Alcanivorax quisquiliarum TaxID=2933565 RepID=A0ABT0E7D5_9GAMM|nr:TetR/AcrR family transcriptional regulator [Alcanivorax quisquiliarum]MCK0537748.1 TetR/AcrR family transcriptional regulator [Alcanivorax quisquiliarum]